MLEPGILGTRCQPAGRWVLTAARLNLVVGARCAGPMRIAAETPISANKPDAYRSAPAAHFQIASSLTLAPIAGLPLQANFFSLRDPA